MSDYTLFQSPASPYKPAQAPAAPPAATTPAGPAINTLFTYDASFSDFAPLLQAADFVGAKSVAIKTHQDLSAELAKYGTIKTLVIFTHSIPGSLLLGGASKTSADVDAELAKSKVKVTGKVVFEGCSIMEDPVECCRMIKSIVSPSAVAIGYNWFSVTQAVGFNFSGIRDAGEVQKQLDAYDKKYWLKPLPAATSLLGQKPTIGRRWFRDTLDETVAEKVQRGIASYADLKKVYAKTRDEADALSDGYSEPVTTPDLITISNIAAVAK